jgi:outer membrane protein assembly factor BamB
MLNEATGLLAAAVPTYFGALSPLDKDLTVRADEWAAMRLNRLRMRSRTFSANLEKAAREALTRRSSDERLARLLEFPGTRAAQQALEALLAEADRKGTTRVASLREAADRRKHLWRLADMARIAGLSLPDAFRARLLAPPPTRADPPPAFPLENRIQNIEEARGTAWLVLERRGDRATRPDLAFLGGRVKKKLDTKFVLTAMNLATGKPTWKAREKRGDTWFDEIRLQDKGNEPGFFEAFVHDDIVIVHGLFDVLAFDLANGKLRWRYKVPFAFEIQHAIKSGDLLILAGEKETLALYLGTRDPRGEVVWQEREQGDPYGAPYLHDNRLITVRRMPFNLTTRYRSTGRLIGRLALPDLSLHKAHPLLKEGPAALPVAHDGNRLVVTDREYYIMLDVERMRVLWKRLIDANDWTPSPPLRFELNGDYFAVLKRDYDIGTIYMLSSRTGEVLWHTDPKNRRSPRPIHSMLIRDGKLYGILPRDGQRFFFVGMDCRTGKPLFRPNEQKGYSADPTVRLRHALHGNCVAAEIRDRQDFELKAFDVGNGKLRHEIDVKAAGRFGEHGRASGTVQNGIMVLLGGHEMKTAVKP